MHIAIIVNAKIHNRNPFEQKNLDQLAAKYHLTYELYICKPNQIGATIQSLLNKIFHVFLIAGGDGTIHAAVQKLVDTDIPIAILPVGTFNHFAKELNLINDLAHTFKLIALQHIRQVDVGEVNGQIFINNSSIGFYSHVLKLKEKYQDYFAQNKFLKIIFTAFNIFNVIPIYQLKINIEGEEMMIDTCLVFIGNNYYHLDLTNMGNRAELTGGQLSVYLLKCKSRWQMIRCIFAKIFNTAAKEKYLFETATNHLTIASQSKYINIIVDGELIKLKSPLNYIIHPKKLSVIVPKQ